MLRNKYLKQWLRIISYYLPNLSLPQATGLAVWSFGMVMTHSSSLTRVSTFIARLNQEKMNTVRQRLREWYQEATAKKGKKRNQLEVSKCFAPLLQWVLSLYPATIKDLAIALDATNIGSNFTVLSVSVLYRSCGIPIAWCVVKATQPGAWQPHWQQLLQHFEQVLPAEWKVIVCADRGLYADWLYAQILALGWHPFLRINHQGTYRLLSQQQWHSLKTIVTPESTAWSGQVTCFKTNPIACTLLARWQAGYQDPWLILTDLAPTQADAVWYGLRAWIECGYRDIKSDGWQWQKTRLTATARAERLWLAMAVATLWIVTYGGEVDQNPPTSLFTQLPPTHIAKTRPRLASPPRHLSCFVQGLLSLVADLINGLPLPFGRLLPLPLTSSSPLALSNTS